MNDWEMGDWEKTQNDVREWATVEGWLEKDEDNYPTVSMGFDSKTEAALLSNQLLRVPGIVKVTVVGESSTHVEYQREEQQ